ncbi:MAG TPA: hypothetical protein DCR24_11370, partial [Bacillus bacterium]|nr:hypothetical protein [Bacillus sp. (in: firmicutes)]
MKQRKTLIKMIMLVVMTAVLPGCWDQHEIDEKAYVIAIGLDEHEAEGKVKVTYLIANPEVGSQQTGGSSNSESPEEIITVIADDFISSRNIANAVTSKIISYDLLKVMVISEDLASDQNFI